MTVKVPRQTLLTLCGTHSEKRRDAVNRIPPCPRDLRAILFVFVIEDEDFKRFEFESDFLIQGQRLACKAG